MAFDLDPGLAALLLAIGFVGSMISGMVGIGGSIIKYPMLLYIPPALGFAAFTAQQVSAMSAIQVFFATLSGALVFRKGGYIHKPLVVVMGTAIVAGGFAGGYGSQWLSDSVINATYAVLALIAAVMMFFPKRADEGGGDAAGLKFNRPLAFALSLAIGIVSGIVGAAGAFITVPVMLVILRIPTRVAIASSLVITFVSSIGSTAGKLMGGHMPFWPSVIMIVASLIAAPIGARMSKKIGTKTLQWMLIALISATVVKIWTDLLF